MFQAVGREVREVVSVLGRLQRSASARFMTTTRVMVEMLQVREDMGAAEVGSSVIW